MGTVSAFQHITATYNNTYLGFGGWISEVAGQVSRQRVTGPFSNPNAYAQILVVVVPLALDRLWHERKLFFRILSLWALIACSLSILFTYSRGGFLTLSFAIVLLLIERRPTLLPLVLTAVLGLILMRLLPTTYTERISTLLEFVPSPTTQITDPSFRGRLSENTAGWMMFRDHPILGVGLNNFPTQYQSYSRQLGIDPRSQKRSPASLYVEVLSEQGSLGLIVFASLLWAIHRGLRQAIKRFRDSYEKDLAFLTNAYWVSLAAYLFSAINKNSAYSNIFWMLVGLAFAIANVAFQSYLAERNSQKMETMRQGNSV